MKLIESKLIAKAEGIFCEAMSSVMDLATIGSLFRKKYNLRLSGDANFQDLDVVVLEDKIGFRFDYTAVAYFSIYMDRAGYFLAMEEISAPSFPSSNHGANTATTIVEPEAIRKKMNQLTEAIAETIERDAFKRLIEVNTHTKLNGRLDFMGARFAVFQNKPVYNLIFQGEIAFSFLMDEEGGFLDFAEPKETSDEGAEKSGSLESKVTMEIDDLTIDEIADGADLPEIMKDEDIELIDIDNGL